MKGLGERIYVEFVIVNNETVFYSFFALFIDQFYWFRTWWMVYRARYTIRLVLGATQSTLDATRMGFWFCLDLNYDFVGQLYDLALSHYKKAPEPFIYFRNPMDFKFSMEPCFLLLPRSYFRLNSNY